jgi:hypothetical protein
MIIHQQVRALASASLLALAILSGPMAFAQAGPQPAAQSMSTAQGPAVSAPTPVVRDHRGEPRRRTPQEPTQSSEAPVVRDHRQPNREWIGRFWLVIKKIIIHDDRDLGSGDISINVVVWSRDLACRGGGCVTELVETTLPEFKADSGDERRLDRVVPAAGDSMADASISPAYGIPIYADREYAFAIRGVDKDVAIDDDLGVLVRRITAQNGWGPPGTYTARGNVNDYLTWDSLLLAFETGDNPGGDELLPAHFSVEYEIRRVPGPDLEPTGIEVRRPAGSTDDVVCVNVLNRGALDAGPFQVALSLEGTTAPATIGSTIAVSLASGQNSALCIHTTLPTSGQYYLTAVVDDQSRVVEGNETNNTFRQAYTPSGLTTGQAVGNVQPSPSRTATPTPTSSAAASRTGTPTATVTVRAGAAGTPTPTATRSASAHPAGSRP